MMFGPSFGQGCQNKLSESAKLFIIDTTMTECYVILKQSTVEAKFDIQII